MKLALINVKAASKRLNEIIEMAAAWWWWLRQHGASRKSGVNRNKCMAAKARHEKAASAAWRQRRKRSGIIAYGGINIAIACIKQRKRVIA